MIVEKREGAFLLAPGPGSELCPLHLLRRGRQPRELPVLGAQNSPGVTCLSLKSGRRGGQRPWAGGALCARRRDPRRAERLGERDARPLGTRATTALGASRVPRSLPHHTACSRR